MILSAFEKVFGSDYPQRDDFEVVELYDKLYGEGKLPKGDFTIHISSEGKPTGASLKTEKGEISVPTDKMQILVIKMIIWFMKAVIITKGIGGVN